MSALKSPIKSLPLALTTLAALASCAPTERAAERTGSAKSAVIGGTPDAGDPAIVLLAAWPADQTVLDLCTATLVAPTMLLTAAHCVDPHTHPGYQFGVFVGPDANAYPTASTLIPKLLPIAAFHVHPDYDRDPPFTADVALVELAAPLDVTPLPVSFTAPTDDDVGAPARIVGYGQTVYEQPNAAKYSADTVLAAIDPGDTITVGELARRTCIGDSGGPALMDRNGVETVVGVNSYTDLAGCLEPAHYRRTDLYAAFLADYVPVPSGSGGGGAGSGGASAGQGGAGGASEGTGGAGGSDEDDGCSLTARRTTQNSAFLFLAVAALLARRSVAKR